MKDNSIDLTLNLILYSFVVFLSIIMLLFFQSQEEDLEVEQLRYAPVQIETVEPVVNEESKPEFNYDYDYVVRVVGAEARGEPEEGIKAVCEVIYNRAKANNMTPEEVVKQKNQFTAPMPTDDFEKGELVNELCLLTFACNELWYDEPITSFCTIDCNSSWHKSLKYCFTIGNHNFYL